MNKQRSTSKRVYLTEKHSQLSYAWFIKTMFPLRWLSLPLVIRSNRFAQ